MPNKTQPDEATGAHTVGNSRLIDTLGAGLTNREKWLMRRAWVEAWDVGAMHDPIKGMDDWLQEHAADGVTVEMVLAKDAPNA